MDDGHLQLTSKNMGGKKEEEEEEKTLTSNG
jgi:hypothetical protein